MIVIQNNYLVIIPARSGSKGIKNKNIVKMGGKPLIQYTIEIALKLLKNKIVEKAIVSTDSEQYKKIAENLGAEVPFLRPKEISGDEAKSITYVLHALDFYKQQNKFFDAVIILQPTTPLRQYEDVINSINLFKKYKNAESLITCYCDDNISDLLMYLKKEDKAIPLNPNHNKGIRRQEHEPIFIRHGSVYITSVKYLIEKNQIISDFPLMYEIPKSRAINIDSEEDLNLLQKIIQNLQY